MTAAQLARLEKMDGATVEEIPKPVDLKAVVSDLTAATKGDNDAVIAAIEKLTQAVEAGAPSADNTDIKASIDRLADVILNQPQTPAKKQRYKFEFERDKQQLAKVVHAIPVDADER